MLYEPESIIMTMVREFGLDDIRGCLSHKEKTPPYSFLFSIEYIYTKGELEKGGV